MGRERDGDCVAAAVGNSEASARLVGAAPGARPYRRGVLVLGCGFLGVFGGFQAAQGLQTSLNATLGFINLAALYGTFTLLCLVAPPLVGRLDTAIGLRGALLLSSLAYVAMIFSNTSAAASWALPISMSVLVGVAAPVLWTCQNDYLGRSAYHAARAEADPCGGRCEETALAATTAEFNGLFFSIYQFAGMLGNVMASCLMLAFAGSPLMKDVLFCVLGGVSVLGASTFLFMPPVGAAASSSEQASLRDTAALAVSDARMSLLIPLIFTNGMTLSYIVGDFPAGYVSPVAGPDLVGFVAAAFYGVNAAATALWGRLISRGVISRRSAYMGAALCVLAFLAVAALWRPPANFQKHGDSWEQVESPQASHVMVVFLLAGLFAVGDAFFESGPVATLQNYFLGSRDAVPAMANAKLWQSLGYATQFVLGVELSDFPALRAGLLASLTVVSALCVLALDRRAPVQ